MKNSLMRLAICLAALVFLTGCQVGSGGSAGSPYDYSGPSTSAGGGTSTTSGDGTGDGSQPGLDHSPEPTTIGLLGSGLLAYALMKRKKKKDNYN